ncbi:MAG: ASCH domain-containing protein [Chloroflexi bacterium]|nr:ASCH domain-containing protein [Chloroflexota bacterium]
MIFAYTYEKVLAGQKWQTRRIAKPGDSWDADSQRVLISNGRTKYEVGRTIAVQPHRNQKAIGRIRILDIRKETVEDISEDDAIAEGFPSRADFLDEWRHIHGKNADLRAEVWVLEFELIETA